MKKPVRDLNVGDMVRLESATSEGLFYYQQVRNISRLTKTVMYVTLTDGTLNLWGADETVECETLMFMTEQLVSILWNMTYAAAKYNNDNNDGQWGDPYSGNADPNYKGYDLNVEDLAVYCRIVQRGGDMPENVADLQKMPDEDALTMAKIADVLGHWVGKYREKYIPQCDGGNGRGIKETNAS